MTQKNSSFQRISVLLILSLASISHAVDKFSFTDYFKQGNFRSEITTTSFGDRQFGERRNDWMFVGTFEYEWPVADKTTMSITSYPLLLYYLDENKKGDSDYIYAGGIGIAGRQYQNLYMSKGWYAQVGVVPIVHYKEFKNNGSRFNFAFCCGAGYEFDNGMTLSAKYFHISNGNTDKENLGLDMFAASIGWRF